MSSQLSTVNKKAFFWSLADDGVGQTPLDSAEAIAFWSHLQGASVVQSAGCICGLICRVHLWYIMKELVGLK